MHLRMVHRLNPTLHLLERTPHRLHPPLALLRLQRDSGPHPARFAARDRLLAHNALPDGAAPLHRFEICHRRLLAVLLERVRAEPVALLITVLHLQSHLIGVAA
eukprot:2836189-Prymnesium_polylepis.1